MLVWITAKCPLLCLVRLSYGSTRSRHYAITFHYMIGLSNVPYTEVLAALLHALPVRTFWMIEASVQMCICEIIVGVVLAAQMDPVSGGLSRSATVGLIVVVSTSRDSPAVGILRHKAGVRSMWDHVTRPISGNNKQHAAAAHVLSPQSMATITNCCISQSSSITAALGR